jgi:hypothetical protein
VDLVFDGGGVKGITRGAIRASLVVAGYSGPEIEHVVRHEMHFSSFEDPQHLRDGQR